MEASSLFSGKMILARRLGHFFSYLLNSKLIYLVKKKSDVHRMINLMHCLKLV